MGILTFFKKNKNKEAEKFTGSFSEWHKLVEDIVGNQYEVIPFDRIIEEFPDNYSSEYDPLLADAVGKLETYALKKTINSFNRVWNRGITENDITCVKRAWLGFRNALQECLFFRKCVGFPEDIAKQVENQVVETAESIQASCEKYIRRAEDESGSEFMKDIYYMIRRDKLQIR